MPAICIHNTPTWLLCRVSSCKVPGRHTLSGILPVRRLLYNCTTWMPLRSNRPRGILCRDVRENEADYNETVYPAYGPVKLFEAILSVINSFNVPIRSFSSSPSSALLLSLRYFNTDRSYKDFGNVPLSLYKAVA